MAVYKLRPACKDYLWGGRRLIEEYEKETTLDILAETWELSCYPDSPSVIANGAYGGKPLRALIDAEGKERVLGTRSAAFDDFPVLVKFIDAAKPLSIQVHPDDAYAQAHGEPFGKNEMWYILEAQPDAYLYLGFDREYTEAEFRMRIEDGTLEQILNRVPVHPGDTFFIPCGTLHAIGAGVTLAEIQQNSNATYRVYDFKRKDRDGRERPLHIEQAVAVTKRAPYTKVTGAYPHIAACASFVVDRVCLDGTYLSRAGGMVDDGSFLHLLVADGTGELRTDTETVPFERGDSLFLTAGSGSFSISGTCDALLTRLP